MSKTLHRFFRPGLAGMSSSRFFAAAITASVLGLSTCPTFAAAEKWVKVPWTEPKIPASQIACYHQAARLFTAEHRPAQCIIAGYEGQQKRFVVVALDQLNWGHWGAGRTRAPQAIETRSGRPVVAILWRRIRCEGGTWYSAALILDSRTGHYRVIRPPFCGEP